MKARVECRLRVNLRHNLWVFNSPDGLNQEPDLCFTIWPALGAKQLRTYGSVLVLTAEANLFLVAHCNAMGCNNIWSV